MLGLTKHNNNSKTLCGKVLCLCVLKLESTYLAKQNASIGVDQLIELKIITWIITEL